MIDKRQFGIAASGFHGTLRGMTEVHERDPPGLNCIYREEGCDRFSVILIERLVILPI